MDATQHKRIAISIVIVKHNCDGFTIFFSIIITRYFSTQLPSSSEATLNNKTQLSSALSGEP